jgi:hypothetical protein
VTARTLVSPVIALLYYSIHSIVQELVAKLHGSFLRITRSGWMEESLLEQSMKLFPTSPKLLFDDANPRPRAALQLKHRHLLPIYARTIARHSRVWINIANLDMDTSGVRKPAMPKMPSISIWPAVEASRWIYYAKATMISAFLSFVSEQSWTHDTRFTHHIFPPLYTSRGQTSSLPHSRIT